MIESPATHADWLALLAGRGIKHEAPQHRTVLTQMAAGPAWAYRPSSQAPPCALMGIMQRGDDFELWFSAGKDLERHQGLFVLYVRRRIAAERKRLGHPIVARISAFNLSEQRLAAIVGLKLDHTTESIVDPYEHDAIEMWSTD